MHREIIKYFQETALLSPGNMAYIEEQYDAFLQNPDSVSPEWRKYFEELLGRGALRNQEAVMSEVRQRFLALGQLPRTGVAAVSTDNNAGSVQKALKHGKLEQLIEAYRHYGHFNADIDPLKRAEKKIYPTMNPEFYGFTSADYDQIFEATSFMPDQKASLKAIIAGLKATYCGSIGSEYAHLSSYEEKEWIRSRLEAVHSTPQFSSEKKQRILKMLIWAEEFERYLGAKFVGQTRFSLEGGCTLIPMLDELIQRAGEHQVKECIAGMGHRGRLSVLANVLGLPISKLFAEFAKKPQNGDRSGDVKYHVGVSSNIETDGGIIHTALAFNPSHLEIVDPVVEGAVRARQDRRNDATCDQVIPVLIHGDAAFTGQGVVMETFNFSQTPGFTTGGTVHIVVNNQIGFTTSSKHDARSGWYCTDIAKMVEAPIFHVNGDDPEAAVWIIQLAVDFRMKFKRDVVIDLVCYRRLGHNEADEPAATQPQMYQFIRQYPRTWEIYLKHLSQQNIADATKAETIIKEYRQILDEAGILVKTIPNDQSGMIFANWRKYKGFDWTTPVNTTLSAEELRTLGEKLLQLPTDFTLQTQVQKEYESRAEMLQGKTPFNWGMAESLAYASILKAGYSVRLTGQDVGRGTFAHRHAVLHDQKAEKLYTPLQQFASEHARFSIYDSTLSEEGVLGFEYGFATTDPEALVLWEAQYGDFVNGAQVVIDQFITSGEQKWSRLCGLTMMLPHSYEGAGPEHSSARLERFLQACAQDNIQVCVPSTPAQVFHMLRRQILRTYRKPLIVIMPKSLLRNKLAVSELTDFTQGGFQTVIAEVDNIPQKTCKKIIICSGKVYYDLLKQRREMQQTNVALLRLEQLYPFPTEALVAALRQYPQAKQVVWCQEEPQNQGAWYSIYHHLIECISKEQTLSYAGRPPCASPATGYAGVHQEEQAKLVAEALA